MKRCTSCKAIVRDDAGACVRCNGGNFSPSDLEVVDGRYALVRRLGEGGMGVVFLAHDVDLGREVALKLVATEHLARYKDALRREAAALAAIRNPHVVQVFDFGTHRDSYFFAMEYVHGRSLSEGLHDFRAHDNFVPVHRTLTIILQIASGLTAAHAAGIVHRDVTPSNVVIERETGRPVLVDFGLAHRPAHGHPGDTAGTLLYMAPEQLTAGEGPPLGPAADVYGLACTAFELLVNRPPFVAVSREELIGKHVAGRPPALSSLRRELSPLDEVMTCALARSPGARYGTCAELSAAFERAGEPWLKPPSSGTPRMAPSEAPDPLGALRILVVDDDDAFRRFAARAAQLAMGDVLVSVSAVGSGREAIANARRKPPQLVMLDYDLPGLDGLETLSGLRALPRGTEARVIVVSGRTREKERWRFAMLGVHDFVDKPVQLPDLVATISGVAARNDWTRHETLVSGT